MGGLVKTIDPNHLVCLGAIAGQCGSNEADYLNVNASPFVDRCDYHDYHFYTSPIGNTTHGTGSK